MGDGLKGIVLGLLAVAVVFAVLLLFGYQPTDTGRYNP